MLGGESGAGCCGGTISAHLSSRVTLHIAKFIISMSYIGGVAADFGSSSRNMGPSVDPTVTDPRVTKLAQ